MGNLFPPPAGGSKAPMPPVKYKCLICGVQCLDRTDLAEHCANSHPELDPPIPAKKIIPIRARLPNKERDLLIECKGLLHQLKDYKALNGQRTTGKRIKELLGKIEAVLE